MTSLKLPRSCIQVQRASVSLGWITGAPTTRLGSLPTARTRRSTSHRPTRYTVRALGLVPDAGREVVRSRTRFYDALEIVPSDERRAGASGCVLIDVVTEKSAEAWKETQTDATRQWIDAVAFEPAKAGAVVVVPKVDGSGGVGIEKVVLSLGSGDPASWWHFASLATSLPKGHTYVVKEFTLPKPLTLTRACLAWALGTYSFDTYFKTKNADAATRTKAVLACPANAEIMAALRATFMARDLITMPAEDMSPAQLELAISSLGAEYDATVSSTIGDDLLKDNFPQIHAVGRAAQFPDRSRAPRLIDMQWGNDESLPLLVLVGKGVCFDTGGLDIKPAGAMRNMKKDMGGAAAMLALAEMIMAAGLQCRLRLLVAAVENNIAGDAFRPGDVLRARNGKTTEVDNTDAEGRLVLADCLALADEAAPDLVVDAATLTGAQRVAHGTDIAGVFSTVPGALEELQVLGEEVGDPVWSLPLYQPYRRELDSKVADMKNCGSGGYGGAITAALYLKEFIGKDTNWIHMDFMGYNPSPRPGRPEGGEVQGVRTLFQFLRKRYSGGA